MKKKIFLLGILFVFIIKFLFFNEFIYNDNKINIEKFNYSINNINEINISLTNANVEIIYGDVNDINVILTQNIIETETKKMTSFQDGNILTISEFKKKQEFFPFYQFGTAQIIIPKNQVINNLSINGEAINLINNISINNFKINVDSLSGKINNIIKNMEINFKKGELNIDNATIEKEKITTESGEINIYNSNIFDFEINASKKAILKTNHLFSKNIVMNGYYKYIEFIANKNNNIQVKNSKINQTNLVEKAGEYFNTTDTKSTMVVDMNGIKINKFIVD